mmetsp:Transcript_124885/g.388767  ORF Transcript_124885/g.388767 Transcript_124885/m.388767 type:complete len:246 (-) Transcript_124885:76-813(-)|eukprot:CAMPEP_0204598614 /NCGR_PEP_ID=MMETSP0661-20131031/54403_1 /ASSEMBLY_ACC=CAM_ASM_000606 /TAXON_ID=109239 /ORGANISM="Alexandrium margalefi, Strain AMGDE01CS-322" /LENGTH=245 /DNA_ID=CAMNT_0051609323 /DNA_START=28 /DNA_END=765 /DNA_ORIENTATION=-
MYLVHAPAAALILTGLVVAVPPPAAALERVPRGSGAPSAPASGGAKASLSLLGSLPVIGVPSPAPASLGGPSLGFALLQRLRQHRQGNQGGGMHGTRVIVLVVLVCLVVVPILLVFMTPMAVQRILDEHCFWFVKRGPEAPPYLGKGPVPPSGALKKGGRPAAKKRVSFSQDALQAPSSTASLTASPPTCRASPSAFTSPVASEGDLERGPRGAPPRVLNDAGYGGGQRASLTGQSRAGNPIPVH